MKENIIIFFLFMGIICSIIMGIIIIWIIYKVFMAKESIIFPSKSNDGTGNVIK